MRTTKQLQRFYAVEVFRPQPPIPGSQGSESVSLPCGMSAFDRRQNTTRDNRLLIEETSPSIRMRSRNHAPSEPGGYGWSIHRGGKMNKTYGLRHISYFIRHISYATWRMKYAAVFLAFVSLPALAQQRPLVTEDVEPVKPGNVRFE